MDKEFTLVRLRRTTAERLRAAGQKGESYDEVITNIMDRAEIGE